MIQPENKPAKIPSQGNTLLWIPGQFGFQSKTDLSIISALRVVQIGWAIGKATAKAPEVKSEIIKPEGFTIMERATGKHNISQDQAINQGKPIRDALQIMMHDILECCEQGGRIVAHHLDFDAGVISQELQRAGLMNYKDAFEREVRRGICTMDAEIVYWVRAMMDIREIPRNIPMKLIEMVKILIPNMIPNSSELRAGNHSAGADAHMHWMVCRELVSMCQ